MNFKKENLRVLDALRGLAAIYVVFSHARWLLWEGFGEGYRLHPELYTTFDKFCMVVFSAFRFGHEAVVFFFVLSGFVIHYSSSSRFEKLKYFSIKTYLFRRIRRIYPPFLFALLATFLLDCIGKYLLDLPMYFSNTKYMSINSNVTSDHSLTTLLGNLGFVHTVYTPVWGTNGALWSLMYEWWFYMLYIPIFYFFRKNKILTALVILVVWYINMRWGVPPRLFTVVLQYFMCWFSGMLLAEFFLSKNRATVHYVIYIVLVALTSLFFISTKFGLHTLIALAICILLYFMLTTNIFGFLNKLDFLAPFSYTLYVIHVPMLRLLSGIVMNGNNGYLPIHFGYVILGVALACTAAYLLHFITERPFTKNKG